jgi:elongation factor P
MINATELRNGTVIKEGKELLQVIIYEHNKMGRGSGSIKVKVRNLRTGAITEKGYITGARVEDAQLEKRKVQYLYRDGDSFNFMDPQSYEQFSLSAAVLGDSNKYLKDNMEVILLISEGESLGMELPNSLIYQTKETGPEEKGNTVSNVYKEAVLDNDLIVKVPMFMKVGDRVKIDTRTGQYVERVK